MNKIKCISFLPEFIPLIKSGEKTVTRRIKTNLEPGDIVYFKSGRTGKKEGYIKIIKEKRELLDDIKEFWYNTIEEFKKEGFKNIENFIEIWNKLNKKGFKWKDNPIVFRIEFQYLGEDRFQVEFNDINSKEKW